MRHGTVKWQIQVPVRTGISVQQGMISIAETKSNHIRQGLGYTGGGGGGRAKTVTFSNNAVTIAAV